MKFAVLILLTVGLCLIAGSYFVGNAAPTQSEQQQATYEQAVTDLHGIADGGESAEEMETRVAAAGESLRAAEDEAAAAEARSRRVSWLMQIAGLLVIVSGFGLHLFAARHG